MTYANRAVPRHGTVRHGWHDMYRSTVPYHAVPRHVTARHGVWNTPTYYALLRRGVPKARYETTVPRAALSRHGTVGTARRQGNEQNRTSTHPRAGANQ